MNTNVRTTPTGHDEGDHYTASGMRVPAAEVRAREIAEQAGRWLTFATERTRMKPHTLTAKALTSTAFSVHRGASSFAVPSKLTGTSKHQRSLWALVQDPAEPWAQLEVDAVGEGFTASHDGEALGLVQSKHLGWVRPLISFGLTLHLARVTGHDYEGYSLGCNVVFGRVGVALGGLLTALGMSGDSGGDGAPNGPMSAGGAVAVSEVSADHGATQVAVLEATQPLAGTPSPSPLRLVVLPEHEALTGAPDDVVLYRRIDGSACASVDHVVRHSPTGIEWGYGGSGPADLALSVLHRVTDPTCAEALYQRFKAEVVASVPHAGGFIRAADVRAWIAAQTDR